MSSVWLYSGSFDPPTLGHMDIIKRAMGITDKLVIGVGKHDSKKSLLSAEERKTLLEESLKDISGGAGKAEVCVFEGLVVDFAKECGARIILRSLRNTTDLNYEESMAIMNRSLDGKIETVFLVASGDYAHISSTLVRQIFSMGRSLEAFAPKAVAHYLEKKRSDRK